MTVRKRILLVFGTRPEAIKMAPVYLALRAQPDAFETLCCVTGQHRQMLDQVLNLFGIVPDLDLDLMRPGQDLTDVTTSVLTAMRTVLQEQRPDLVLVHGDTATCFAAALAAFYAGVPVGHVEAGLRSGDIRAPFPEEVNRRGTALIASYHFAPTQGNRDNLLAEGCDPAGIVVTGNSVVDAVKHILARIDTESAFRAAVERDLDAGFGFDWRSTRYVLVTCHRRETVLRGLDGAFDALERLAQAFPDTHFVYAAHLNPAARAREIAPLPNLHFVEPLSYEVFLHALRSCYCVLTDSGGVHEEAPHLGVPALVMRDVTERPEALATGIVRLVGTTSEGIFAATAQLLADPDLRAAMSRPASPFGNGDAGDRIAAFLREFG